MAKRQRIRISRNAQTLVVAVTVLLLVGTTFSPFNLTAAAPNGTPNPDDLNTDFDFSGDVQPFLKTHCYRCHGEQNQESGLALHAIDGDSNSLAALARWENIFEKLGSGEMPPAEEKQPKALVREQVSKWINSKLNDAGHPSEWERKLLFPEYGNYVNHERLFDGSVKELAWSPSRLWKRSPYIFDSMLIRGVGLAKGRNQQVPASLQKVKQPFTLEEKAGILDYAAVTFADSATLGTMIRNAEVMVDKHLEGAMHELDERVNGPIPENQWPKDKQGKPVKPRYQKTANEFRDIILTEATPTNDQFDTAIRKMYELVIERDPSIADLDKYRQLIHECLSESDNAEGLRLGLIAIAISPAAIYRLELGSGPSDAHGRQMLSPVELAYAIAYALTDERPDQELIDAATNGRLTSRDDVAREVTRIWDDDALEKPRVLRCFQEYFGYHNAPNVFKDVSRFGKDYRKVAENLVADCDTLVSHIVQEDNNVLQRLLTTDEYFVAHAGNDEEIAKTIDSLNQFYEYYKDKDWKNFQYKVPQEYAAYARSIDRMFTHANGNVVKRWMSYLTICDQNGITPIPRSGGRQFIEAYNLDEKSFNFPVQQPFVLAEGKRVGILMHPAWLIAQSLNLDNDPVRRGKWIRERLLAGTVPELPISVDASIPDAPELSLRERFSVTRQSECWRCHVKMNPLGMPFELFDDFGRYRDVEVLHAKGKTKPVDCTGVLVGCGDPELDGVVSDPIEMMQRLAKSERVRQSFVRHAFRYWMGRNEMLSDSATLIAADHAYVQNDGSFRELVISLLTSDSFLYRKAMEK